MILKELIYLFRFNFRKSKWDQPAPVAGSGLKPAVLVQPSLTSNVTGTKGTIISAFGSLPKKPKP